ncbi:hypothetical protein EV426DRAFT_644965, partial [Tirmania nivea]
MNIRDMLNPVTEGSESPRLRRCTPIQESIPVPRQTTQPPPPTALPREWVIIARGDFPKGQPHRDKKFVRLNPPLYDGEEQLKYHIQFQLPEVGPYEILDEHIIQSPMPERYINAKPEFPHSELHEDALKVIEDTSYEPVVRVWVEHESAGENRKAVFIRVEHVRRLPRIEGWQVVKKTGGGILTRYMVMVAPDATGQTPLSWVWMTVLEIREQLPEQCDELVREYREYNPSLLRTEAKAERRQQKERAPVGLKRRQEGQPVQIEATPGEGSTTETDGGEGEVTEVDSDAYDQPPSPKRQRMSPVASYSVAGVSPQGESSPSLLRGALNRPQRVPEPESQPLDELEQSSPPGTLATAGPSFTPINIDPPTPARNRRDSSQFQPLGDLQRLRPFAVRRNVAPSLSPGPLGLEPSASYKESDLDLFLESQPERYPLAAPTA